MALAEANAVINVVQAAKPLKINLLLMLFVVNRTKNVAQEFVATQKPRNVVGNDFVVLRMRTVVK